MKMKKIFTLFLVALSPFMALAQRSLTVTNTQPVVFGLPSDGLLESDPFITNTSNSAVNVKVTSIVLQQMAGSISNFCWGINCYPPAITTSPNSISVAAGASNNSFKADYAPESTVGISRIKYCFFVEGNTADSVCTIVTFNTGPNAAIRNVKKADVMKAFPNPATDVVGLTFPAIGETSNLEVVNIIGKVVYLAAIPTGTTSHKIDIKDLPAGQYFASIKADGKRSFTTRFIVK